MTEAGEWPLIIARLESRISCSWNFLMERRGFSGPTHSDLSRDAEQYKKLPEDKKQTFKSTDG